MNPIVYLFDMIFGIFNTILIGWVIINILLRLNILNHYNEVVQKIMQTLSGLIDPILRPIRRYIPSFGGIDISPLILMLIINFIRYTLHYYFA